MSVKIVAEMFLNGSFSQLTKHSWFKKKKKQLIQVILGTFIVQILNRVLNKHFSIVQNGENLICSLQEHKHKVGFDLLSAALLAACQPGRYATSQVSIQMSKH